MYVCIYMYVHVRTCIHVYEIVQEITIRPLCIRTYMYMYSILSFIHVHLIGVPKSHIKIYGQKFNLTDILHVLQKKDH